MNELNRNPYELKENKNMRPIRDMCHYSCSKLTLLNILVFIILLILLYMLFYSK